MTQISSGKVPTAPTIASMMAALEVQEALKLLHGMPVAAGTALVFNGVANQFYSTRLPFREDCLSHETYPEPGRAALGHGEHGRRAFRGSPAAVCKGRFGWSWIASSWSRSSARGARWRGEVMRPRGQGQGVRGDLPELPAAGPARVRERASRKIRPWLP